MAQCSIRDCTAYACVDKCTYHELIESIIGKSLDPVKVDRYYDEYTSKVHDVVVGICQGKRPYQLSSELGLHEQNILLILKRMF